MADGGQEYRPSHRDRLVARAITTVAAAVKRGLLPEAETCKCLDCGAQAEQYDHRNYYHPLAVDPVCRRCNLKRGPGFPPIQPGDGFPNKRHTIETIPHAGARWSSVEPDGKAGLKESPVHVAVPDDDYVDDRFYMAITRTFFDFFAYLRRTGKPHEEWSRSWTRYEYFKAHDPWAL